jgi:hypothetical protein
MALLPKLVPLGVATHGCCVLELHLPKVREYAGERILIPDGKPKRALRKRKKLVVGRRRRTVREVATVH